MNGKTECQPIGTELHDCDTGIECPSANKYSEWSSWSACSKTCTTSAKDISIQTRSRSCEGPMCTLGILERRPCQVQFCPPGFKNSPDFTTFLKNDFFSECPQHILRSMEQDDRNHIEVKAIMAVHKAKVTYGKLKKQEIKLEPISSIYTDRTIQYKELVWGETDFGNDGISSDKFVPELILKATYQPVIRVYTEILVNDKSNPNPGAAGGNVYKRASTLIQECPRTVRFQNDRIFGFFLEVGSVFSLLFVILGLVIMGRGFLRVDFAIGKLTARTDLTRSRPPASGTPRPSRSSSSPSCCTSCPGAWPTQVSAHFS